MPIPNHLYVSNYSQESDEWWAPTWLIEASHEVLGRIDLDPASTPLANERVRAEHIFTKEDNGLEQEWFGNVFLNPPSKRADPTARPYLWARKLSEEYDTRRVRRAILIVKSVLGYNWYESLYKLSLIHISEPTRPY